KKGSMLKGRQFMPVEFSAAAYRFGHSMVRPEYNVSSALQHATLERLFRFSGRSGSAADVPIQDNWVVEWTRLLHEDPPEENTLSRRIDPYLTDQLGKIPMPGGPRSLPELNLLRGNRLSLPSGQCVAKFFEYKALSPEQFDGPDGEVARKHKLDENTPLWYYV